MIAFKLVSRQVVCYGFFPVTWEVQFLKIRKFLDEPSFRILVFLASDCDLIQEVALGLTKRDIKLFSAVFLEIFEDLLVKVSDGFILWEVVLVVVKHFFDFLFCQVDLLHCAFDHDFVDWLSWVRNIGCLSFFNWLRLYSFLLLCHHSLKFFSFWVKSKNTSNAMIRMAHIHLRPSCIIKTSMLIWAVYIIWEFVLLHVPITSDPLSLHELQSALYTHLIVCFNLEVLVRIIKDAGQVIKSSFWIAIFVWLHLVRPPALEFFNRWFDSTLARKHLSLAHLRLFNLLDFYLSLHNLTKHKHNFVVLQEFDIVIIRNCFLNNSMQI